MNRRGFKTSCATFMGSIVLPPMIDEGVPVCAVGVGAS